MILRGKNQLLIKFLSCLLWTAPHRLALLCPHFWKFHTFFTRNTFIRGRILWVGDKADDLGIWILTRNSYKTVETVIFCTILDTPQLQSLNRTLRLFSSFVIEYSKVVLVVNRKLLSYVSMFWLWKSWIYLISLIYQSMIWERLTNLYKESWKQISFDKIR